MSLALTTRSGMDVGLQPAARTPRRPARTHVRPHARTPARPHRDLAWLMH
jgi:hypothetical protein